MRSLRALIVLQKLKHLINANITKEDREVLLDEANFPEVQNVLGIWFEDIPAKEITEKLKNIK